MLSVGEVFWMAFYGLVTASDLEDGLDYSINIEKFI